MDIQKNFKELLELLRKNEVRYMVVGGYAVSFYDRPRYTKSIDIFYDNSPDNIQRLQQALLSFGLESVDIPAELFRKNGNIVVFGIEPNRVDLLNEIDGVDFNQAYKNAQFSVIDGNQVVFISKRDLICNKMSTGRIRDLADAEDLKQ